eukprot:419356-Prymnesium_polylepis.1
MPRPRHSVRHGARHQVRPDAQFGGVRAASKGVFSLLKQMSAEQQMCALADYIRAALMLKYNERMVGCE